MSMNFYGAGVVLTAPQFFLLQRLPVDLADLDGYGRRALAGLVKRGCASEEIEQAVITPKGREVLNGGGKTGAPTQSKSAEPAKPARRGQARKTSQAEKTSVGTRARREPAATAPNPKAAIYALRAQLVAEHAAELAAVDKVLEIVSELA